LPHDPFHFTITDAARFLGKSPVTLRKWERTGFWTFPRNGGTDRRLGLHDVEAIAHHARAHGRINSLRYADILAAVDVLQRIERENT
jgi:hypothetical protein